MLLTSASSSASVDFGSDERAAVSQDESKRYLRWRCRARLRRLTRGAWHDAERGRRLEARGDVLVSTLARDPMRWAGRSKRLLSFRRRGTESDSHGATRGPDGDDPPSCFQPYRGV